MSEHVRVENEGDVLALTLARPERRNAITVAMYAALADAIEQAQDDPALRLITFAAKARISRPATTSPISCQALPRDGEEIAVWRLLRALAVNELPLIAAVHGNAIGIGTTMLLHCDVVLAEEGTRFLMPFVDLGLVPEAASSLLLPAPRRAPPRRTLSAAGRAVRARGSGRVRPGQQGRAEGRARSGAIAKPSTALLAKPAEALRLTQKLLRHGTREEVLERFELENGHFSERLESAEVKQVITAFFEKKKPTRP